MKLNRLELLFLCDLVIFGAGSALVPLLPIRALQMGGSIAEVGAFMAFAYLALAVGTALTGRLVERFQCLHLVVVVGVADALAYLLLGQANDFRQLAALTAVVWFCAGVVTTIVSIYTSQTANRASRGKTFGLMYLAVPVGALLGGTTIGRLTDWQGYSVMFVALGLVHLSVPVLGYFALKGAPAPPRQEMKTARDGQRALPPQAFLLLLLAVLLFATTIYIGRLGTSLAMQTLSFSAGAVTSTAALGGLVAIPIIPWIGALSDRLGRRRFLSMSYLLAVIGIAVLGRASDLWHFWLVAACLSVANFTSTSISSALASDLLSSGELSRGMARLSAMGWVAGIIGFASGGYLVESVGMTTLYRAVIVLPVVALILVNWLPGKRISLRPVLPVLRQAPWC